MVLHASYRRVSKNTRKFTALLPFFGTDYGIWDDSEIIPCRALSGQDALNRFCGEVSFSILVTLKETGVSQNKHIWACSTLMKPQITFNPDLEHVPFETLMRNFTETIE